MDKKQLLDFIAENSTNSDMKKNIQAFEKNIIENLGNVLKEKRLEQKFTLEFVSIHTKIARSTIQRIERGGNCEYSNYVKLFNFYEKNEGNSV